MLAVPKALREIPAIACRRNRLALHRRRTGPFMGRRITLSSHAMHLVLALFAVAALAAETVTENHPDGSKALTVAVDKDGKRDGALTAWWSGGKVLKEKSKWDKGELHGLRTLYDEKGKPVVEETWIKGRLVYPRSQAQVAAGLQRIEAEVAALLPTWPKSGNAGAPAPVDESRALARLRQYRWLVGLAHDVSIEPRYTDEAQEAAEVLAAIGRLDHHPKQPAGWADADFAKAKSGCGHGNLAMGVGDLVRAVDLWMDDSDPSNIDALGHRRWMLNPVMQTCGFGISGKFSVIWAHDDARKEPPPQAWQAFPPPGYVPVTHFGNRHAWHLSLNPKDYSVDLKSMTFQIFALDERLQRQGGPLALDHDGSNDTGYGCYKNARIVRPDAKSGGKGQAIYSVAKNRSYEAVVGALKPKGQAPAEISWIVTFF